ncbi:MAG: peptidyl-alpha-hydroxyglycine alpha-amidating lyase family protein [Chthoniobacterales bacterium]
MKLLCKICLAISPLLFSVPAFAQANVPEIPYDSVPDFLNTGDNPILGEAVGVATNSKCHVYVFTRSGSDTATLGTNRVFVRGAARLFEYDEKGKFVREIGQGLYGFVFAHVVRVDPQDNIWVVDEGSSMVIKFDPQGRVVMTMGRKPEAINVPAAGANEGGAGGGRGGAVSPTACVGTPGDNFNRPSDVAWNAAGDIFVADGYGNSRVAKFDKNGKYIKCWGQKGTAPGQFNVLHSIAVDAQGLVYVADRENHRIQVFDGDGNFKTQYTNVGAPWALCITPGPHQYMYSSNSNYPNNLDNGEIYKMELNGAIVGKFGKAGHMLKEFGSAHELDCRSENEMLVGEILNWRVQKLTLHPTGTQTTSARKN